MEIRLSGPLQMQIKRVPTWVGYIHFHLKRNEKSHQWPNQRGCHFQCLDQVWATTAPQVEKCTHISTFSLFHHFLNQSEKP